MTRRLCALIATLMIVPACGTGTGTPSSDAPAAAADSERPTGDPDWTPEDPFGKKDFAAVEAELRCVEEALTGPERAEAEAAVHRKWKRSAEWVESVRAQVKAEPEFEDSFARVLAKNRAALCPEGKLSDEFRAVLGLDATAEPSSPVSGDAPK